MISGSRLPPQPRFRQQSRRRSPTSVAQTSPYGSPFWFAYIANALFSAGVGVLYHYADFISLLGGTELHLGWIVGVGMVGSLLMRLVMGVGIDRRGPSIILFGSVVFFVLVCLAHLAVTSPTGAAVYLLRIAYCSAMAGYYGALMAFVCNRAPQERMAEMVGMIGTSGFLGNIVGTQLGDYLRGSGMLQWSCIDQMFLAAAALAAAALPLSWLALRGHLPPQSAVHPSLRRILRSYHPGLPLLAVVVVMGVGLNLPVTFLPTYAAELGLTRIAMFFTVYAIAAVLTRLATRSWPQRLGLRTMILLGSGGLALSQLAFLAATSEWLLAVPGIGYGLSHAVLFPATFAVGNLSFPDKHRGVGTMLMLAMWDLGQLVGMPAAGLVIHYSALAGLPPYPVLFSLMAAVLGAITVGYALSSRHPGRLADM
jgi:MFS family permease